ncbi:MAG TPA: hypothetical protein VK819_15800 [Acidobacteriaceae bacterium]|jgi:hypothetical protein|nr:hypothetical protein [Acidobacteriaceae bacterium]
MNWSTVAVSLACSVVVAYLSTHFTHLVWGKQKRREQQLAVAERFANIRLQFYVYANIDPKTTEERLKIAPARVEQDSVLMLICTLFKRRDTILWTIKLRRAINEHRTDIEVMHRLRLDITVGLFAEALGISMNEVSKRIHALDGEIM